MQNYLAKSLNLREELFKKFFLLKQGHPGSIFSIIDFLTVLYYGGFARKKKNKMLDHVIMSKGHATAGQFPILKDLGVISKSDWNNWGTKKKSKLRIFGNNSINGISVTTGSLGHGVNVAAGLGYYYKNQKLKNKIYLIISEGEFYEGSVWEGLLFISHHNLSNIKIFIDRNDLIILGKTENLIKLEPLEKKMKSFGFDTKTIDGHNHFKIEKRLKNVSSLKKVSCTILKTVKGKGIKKMENKPEWHYWNNISKKEFDKYFKSIRNK